jgi:hypothetical protein
MTPSCGLVGLLPSHPSINGIIDAGTSSGKTFSIGVEYCIENSSGLIRLGPSYGVSGMPNALVTGQKIFSIDKNYIEEISIILNYWIPIYSIR